MTRRWEAGTRVTIGGVTYRVVAGKKESRTPGEMDLRLEAWTPDGWQPVPMAAGAFMADYFFENEEILFPPSQGFSGGAYYVRYLQHAISDGWETADEKLKGERQTKRQKATVSASEEAELDALFDVAWAKTHPDGEAA